VITSLELVPPIFVPLIREVPKDIQKRSKELNLVAEEDESLIALNLSTYITALIMNYLYTGRFRGEQKKKRK